MNFPMVQSDYTIATWCPRMIQQQEGRSFCIYDKCKKISSTVTGFDEECVRLAINSENYRYSLKDAYNQKSMVEGREDDRIQMRARKPLFKKIDRSLSLNFGGRVKKSSRKNV
jgi:hypothetical protein